MRPLSHPALDDVTVEGILHALADPVRVALFAQIVSSGCEGGNCTSFAHVSPQAIPRSTLSQHFKALREAGLIRGERHGVEMLNTSRCAEVEGRFPGLLPAILNAHALQAKTQAKATKAAARRAKA